MITIMIIMTNMMIIIIVVSSPNEWLLLAFGAHSPDE